MRWVVILLGLWFALPAVAQDTLRLPDGCTAEATVHKNGCVVTNIVSCVGDTWQAISHRHGNLVSISHYDRDWSFTKWETQGAGAMAFSIVPDSGMAMNIRDLLDIGYHDAEATFVINSKVIRDQQYALTGRTDATEDLVEINGEQFVVFEAVRNFEREGGQSTLNFTMDVYVSMARDLVVEGDWARAVNDTGWQRFDNTPRAIYARDDPGFLATTSEFGCD